MFLEYIKDQQGEDYLEECGYRHMPIETVIELESDHYEDYLKLINKIMICPKCFKEFENFNYEEETYEKGIAEFCKESDEFDLTPNNKENKLLYFKCPECDEVLFNDYDEARKFAMIQK